jgi:hypothetical protein
LAQTFDGFLEAAQPTATPAERVATSRALYETFARGLSGLGLAAIWGLMAGAAAPRLALANIYKVPMVVALSLAVALPGVLVARHLLHLAVPARQIVSALVVSMYRASLVLLGFAPLLGVYAYTSQTIAPLLAQVSALLALACGGVALRSELSRLAAARWQLWLLGGVAGVTVTLALLQLVSLATPVLTLPTVFGSGIEGVLR